MPKYKFPPVSPDPCLFFPPAPTWVGPWLRQQQSLTKILKQRCGNSFRVQRLQQSWGTATIQEARMLNIAPRQFCLIRQVLLLCHDQPWVYARTVIPLKTLTSKHLRLKYLGNKSLGAYLFARGNMHRPRVSFLRLLSDHPLHHLIQQQVHKPLPSRLWGRSTLFLLDQQPLLVSEIFLPGCGTPPMML